MPVDWEVSATTILCEDVDEEVTIIVNKDGTVTCTGSQKYSRPSQEAARELKARSKKTGKSLSCKYPACPTLNTYHDELLSEQ